MVEIVDVDYGVQNVYVVFFDVFRGLEFVGFVVVVLVGGFVSLGRVVLLQIRSVGCGLFF